MESGCLLDEKTGIDHDEPKRSSTTEQVVDLDVAISEIVESRAVSEMLSVKSSPDHRVPRF
jgi:hypothetical protein